MIAFKRFLRGNFVIKPEDIQESVFLLEQRLAREQGHGTIEITEEFKQRKTAEIINNQRQSLDKWIDYIASPDAQYPDWAKYWGMRPVLEMGKFIKEYNKDGKEIGRFQKRTKDTVAAFPPCNPRALAETVTTIKRIASEKNKAKKERQALPNQSTKLNDQDFQQLVSTENFSKIYTQFLVELPEYSTEGLQEIRGKWIKYDQGSDPQPLVNSLEGYPLEWCTAGYDTAQTQLEGGDFYTYYSRDQDGEDKIPRVAIRMEENRIAEVPGIAPNQNLDPYIVPVVEEKMKEFGSEGEVYKKKSEDMKLLTTLEQKIARKQLLTKDDLVFLYEINASIEGFGYDRDPRIAELRAQRDPKGDAPIVLECSPQEIAWSQDEISENTKAYVGPLFPNIFKKFNRLENIYTSFPEEKIRRDTVTIGGKNAEQLKLQIEQAGFQISDYAKQMMGKTTKAPGDPY